MFSGIFHKIKTKILVAEILVSEDVSLSVYKLMLHWLMEIINYSKEMQCKKYAKWNCI